MNMRFRPENGPEDSGIVGLMNQHITRERDSDTTQITAPFGTWKSSISAEMLAGKRVSLDSPRVAVSSSVFVAASLLTIQAEWEAVLSGKSPVWK